ncbi:MULTISPECIES: DUF11 domain-containing protein [Amycolatopsis]|uniref:DUF11 domain-containing protein n=1 Tax=Amycolatopsis dongchuanensis TaxID=1070866 RepID=A0ABP9PW06_9PSEU
MRRLLFGVLGAGVTSALFLGSALPANAAPETADVPLATIGTGPASATLSNGVTASVDNGTWVANANSYVIRTGSQTWTYSEPVNVRFTVNQLNGAPPNADAYECVRFPNADVTVETLGTSHSWDAATSTLCHTGANDTGQSDETTFTTKAPTTSLTWQAVGGTGLARGLSSMAVTVDRPQADLAVAKSGPANVSSGDTIEYTIVVINNGPDASSGYTLTDPVPAGLTQVTVPADCTTDGSTVTCTHGPLGVGESALYTVTGVADGSTSVITNTAQVTGNDPDPNPGNNTSTAVTEVPMVSAGVAAGAFALLGGGWALRRRMRQGTAA